MKVLIFSHISDIDGMGPIILANLAFEQVDYELVGYNDVNQKIQNKIYSKEIYNYDKVFVTDMTIQEPLINELSKDDKLSKMIQIIDHHETAIKQGLNKYPFSHIVTEDENGLCSGTSLFYEYLLNHKLLEPNKQVFEFVELTRRHDTWEWKNIYNDYKADDLAQLFNAVGTWHYIHDMINKLQHKSDHFEFNYDERNKINNYRKMVEEKCKNCAANIMLINFDNIKFGVGEIEHKYRNDIAQYLRDIKYDVEVLAIPDFKKKTCSFRTIKNQVNVMDFASKYFGGGHPYASACPLSEKLMQDLNINKNLNQEKE